jgi:hypothetical protein
VKFKKAIWWLVLVAAGGLAGQTALAAIPDSSGVIHGCYSPSRNGSLRVIDTEANQKCKATEVGLTWNQAGPQGDPGVLGFYVRSATADTALSGSIRINAACDPGDAATGGGYELASTTGIVVKASKPDPPDGWVLEANNTDPNTVTVFVACADLSP